MIDYKEMTDKLNALYFENYEQEQSIINDALACDTYANYLKFIKKYNKVDLDVYRLKSNRHRIDLKKAFKNLKAVRGAVDFI